MVKRHLRTHLPKLLLTVPALSGCVITKPMQQSGAMRTIFPPQSIATQTKAPSERIQSDSKIVLAQAESGPLPPAIATSEHVQAEPGMSAASSLNDLIGLALAQNPMVKAARLNVESLGHRVVQARSLDDPVVSNSIYPIPSVAPQYALMGYMPYDFLIAQQFPWSGTLRRRGMVAEKDVQIALEELAATELDTVADLKKAYADLNYTIQASAILEQNRRLANDFIALAQARFRTGTAAQSDIIRAEISLTEIDREAATLNGDSESSRAELARILGDTPGMEPILNHFTIHPNQDQSTQNTALEELYEIALQARPDLGGRLAAIERDQIAEELASLRGKPNLSLGFIYQNMQKTNAQQPQTAMGSPNIGLFVGFNLPVYRAKIAAGVAEAQARTAADKALYEAERNQVRRDIRTLHNSVNVQRQVLNLIENVNLPNTRRILETVEADYRSGKAGVDALSMLSAWRDVLAVELQVAQVQSELVKTSANLERAVGLRLAQISPAQVAALKPSVTPPKPPAPFANLPKSEINPVVYVSKPAEPLPNSASAPAFQPAPTSGPAPPSPSQVGPERATP